MTICIAIFLPIIFFICIDHGKGKENFTNMISFLLERMLHDVVVAVHDDRYITTLFTTAVVKFWLRLENM